MTSGRKYMKFPFDLISLNRPHQGLKGTRVAFTLFFCVAFFLAAATDLVAIPEYAVLTGNRCINCHVNSAGGGLRNDLGFYATEGISLVKPEWLGLEGIINDVFGTNCAIDRKLFYGLDFRLMSARSTRAPVPAAQSAETASQELPERKLFPMQASAQASFHPASWFFVEGQYNFGPTRYAGQQTWSASANFQPELSLPSLRVGFFQPSISLNYDDHTMLVRMVPGELSDAFIAPYYSEWGAEVRYASPLWLDLSAGAFLSKNMKEVYTYDSSGTLRSVIADDSKPLLNARVAFTPKFFEDQINLFVGASVLSCGDYSMVNAFAAVGWTDHISLMSEHTIQGNKFARQLRLSSLELMGRVTDPLYLFARVDYGQSFNVVSGAERTEYTRQYVFGSKMTLFPFIELRPEYRIIENASAYRTRWTVQLHLYY